VRNVGKHPVPEHEVLLSDDRNGDQKGDEQNCSLFFTALTSWSQEIRFAMNGVPRSSCRGSTR